MLDSTSLINRKFHYIFLFINDIRNLRQPVFFNFRSTLNVASAQFNGTDSNRVLYKHSLLVFKCMNNIGPSYLKEFLIIKKSPGTRHSAKLSLVEKPRNRTESKRAFEHAAPYSYRDSADTSGWILNNRDPNTHPCGTSNLVDVGNLR